MTKIEVLWAESLRQIGSRPIEENGFRLTRIDPETRFDIYAGVDASPFVLLAIGIHVRPPNIAMESSSLDYFRQQRQDGSWLMVLRLRQRGLEAVFGRLCQDLVDASSNVAGEEALIALFKERLNLWKRLFQDGGNGLLQVHQIKGLIAELLVLESLIGSGKRDYLETVVGWVGPLGADQDFLFSDSAIEVKAIRLGADCVTISSLGQLDCAVPMSLVVMVLREATPEEAVAVTINSLVARIEGAIASNPEALRVFNDRLLEAFYVEHEFYDTILFEAVAQYSYSVDEAFPKISADTVSQGIVSANYAISLESIEGHKELTD